MNRFFAMIVMVLVVAMSGGCFTRGGFAARTVVTENYYGAAGPSPSTVYLPGRTYDLAEMAQYRYRPVVYRVQNVGHVGHRGDRCDRRH